MRIEKRRNTCKENIVPSKECKYLVIKEFRNKTNTPEESDVVPSKE